MHTEIEVKAVLRDSDSVIQKLESLGCVFSEPIAQVDMVYATKVASLKEFLTNDVFLRIRIQNDGLVILTAKKPKEKRGDNLIKTEHEVTVSSADEARAILAMMGLQQAVRVKKIRIKTHVHDYEICIDDIEGLGSFIEIERIGDAEGAEEVQEEMFNFLMTLGITPDAQVKKGYDILMWEERGKQKTKKNKK